jgi:hypothetical protein
MSATAHAARMNLHPADRMGEIKTAISKLETEYAELRDLIVSGNATQVGNEWFAVITETSVRRVDLATAERTLEPDVFSNLLRVTRQTRLTLRPLRPPTPKPSSSGAAGKGEGA